MDSPDTGKEAASAKISAQVEEYLARGGEIYQATSADNSTAIVRATRTRKQMIADQKVAHGRSISRDKERKLNKKPAEAG